MAETQGSNSAARPRPDRFTPFRYARFAHHLGDAHRILDVGCSDGRGGAVLRRTRPSAHLAGVEILEPRAAHVPDVYDDVTVGDLATIAARGEQFDALVMGEVIEHIGYGALEGFLANAATVLVPGGRILLTTPNPHYLFLRWRGGSVLGGAHVSVHCPAALTELLEHRGFRVLEVEGTGRVSRVIGTRCWLSLYGSYLLIAERRTEAHEEPTGS